MLEELIIEKLLIGQYYDQIKYLVYCTKNSPLSQFPFSSLSK